MAEDLPEAADVRAVLREHGEPVNPRGRLSPAEVTAYQRVVSHEPPGPAGGYDAGVTEADFPAPGVAAETRPRNVKTGKAPLRARFARARRSRPKSRVAKRVPVTALTSRLWETLGRLASQVDLPLGRSISMGSGVAGLILEDLIRDTMVDRVLQPVARAEAKVEMAMALVGPPACVLALEMAQRLPDNQRQVREALIQPVLLECLVLQVRVSGEKAQEILAREAEEGPAREKAMELLQMIFAPPTAPPGGPGMPDPAPEPQMAGASA